MRALSLCLALSAAAAFAGTPYVYLPINKRDPFGGPRVPLDGPLPKEARCDAPLCRSGLDELRLVAVVSTTPTASLAMFEDRAGNGFVVRRHQAIGLRGGRVTRIERDCVIITEYVDAQGRREPVESRVCVPRDAQLIYDLALGRLIPVP